MKPLLTDRREFMKATGLTLTGLILGFRTLPAARLPKQSGQFSPNAFLAIDQSTGVTLVISCPEIGQNIRTTFAMILADELGADLDTVSLHQAPPQNDLGRQNAGGSGSVRNQFMPLREAAAAAREMLVAAAAEEWNVSPSQCRTEKGTVLGPGTRKRSFESLATQASRQSVPRSAKLKSPDNFRYIGKATRCLDTAAITQGKMQFGIDAHPKDLAFAVMIRSPVHRGRLKSFDADAAMQMRGTKDIFQIGNKIAVIADSTWAAINAARTVVLDWNAGTNGSIDSETLFEKRKEAVGRDGTVLIQRGNFSKAYSDAAIKVEEDFFVPTIAHASLEPPNSTVWFHDGNVEIWGSCQLLNRLYDDLPKITGLPRSNIIYHQLRIGGGFGRKLADDYLIEAIEIGKKVSYPVKMTFSREDDIRHDRYRLADYYRYRAGLTAEGYPVAIEESFTRPMNQRQSRRPSEVMRLFENNVRIHNPVAPGLPGGALRAPGHNITTFVEQCLIDMMAEEARADPIDYHLAINGDSKTLRKLRWDKSPHRNRIICELLKRVKDMSNWKQSKNYGYGVATFSGYGSHCAIVALVSKQGGKRPVEHLFCAVHCGQVINPLGAEAQIEGGIVDSLGATLYQKITLKDGRVQQSNFHDFKLLRINEQPKIDIEIMESTDAPQGLGEVSYPPTAPAITNALFDATGRRYTQMPLRA